MQEEVSTLRLAGSLLAQYFEILGDDVFGYGVVGPGTVGGGNQVVRSGNRISRILRNQIKIRI